MSAAAPQPTDAPVPVLELEAAVLETSLGAEPVDLSLAPGAFGFLRGSSISLVLLGLAAPVAGTVRIRGREWSDLSLGEAERARRRTGVVVNPRSHASQIWISNLDVDENALLAAQFDPTRHSAEVEQRAAELAHTFGLARGLPSMRPAAAPPGELVLAQWVRAFLLEPLDLLVLEEPLDGAPPESAGALALEIARVRREGTAVLWVGATKPDLVLD